MKISSYFFIFVLIICFSLLSFTAPQKEEMDLSQVRKAIEESNLKLREAIHKANASAIADMYTEDAMIMPPNSEIVKGKEAIEAMWNGAIQMGMQDIELTTMNVFGSGDYIYEIGKYTVTMQSEGQDSIQDKGKYVDVWKKTADGSCKLHVNIWNSSMPAQ